MKRRILMVSAMILLLGSQVQMYAQQKGGPDHKRPGMEMHEGRKPGRPMHEKAISQGDIVRLQDFYWKRYRVKLTRREAERILLEQRRDRGPREVSHRHPHPPVVHKDGPRGPQGPGGAQRPGDQQGPGGPQKPGDQQRPGGPQRPGAGSPQRPPQR